VLNFMNLLNPRWGLVEQVEFPYNRTLVRASRIAPGGAFGEGGICAVTNTNGCWQYSNFTQPALGNSNSDAPRRSLWQLKVGVRYTF
jgi:hypothetical protein